MTLSDMNSYKAVIGCLMYRPHLLLEYSDINAVDFDYNPAIVCFNAIRKLYQKGATTISPLEIDQEIRYFGGTLLQVYENDHGLDFLKSAYQYASQISNVQPYYERLKKYSLLRQLHKAKYDISEFYIDNKQITDPIKEQKLLMHLENSSLEDILNSVEKNYSEIRNNFLNGGKMNGDPSDGIYELIENLKVTPSIGPSLEGKIFSSVCRGAREGCFFLKSASTSAGKSRTSIFDACRLAYPKRWSHKAGSFIIESDAQGEVVQPRKVLFIVTEMDKEEIQTIMLAYLSGVDEDHIIRGAYEFNEETRVKYAAHIMKEYEGYFLIEEISEPNLQNVEATIRKYAMVDGVKYVFFDYIHSTASMISQFTQNNIREDVILMMMANQLKQLAKDYNLFIFSATQVNSLAMGDEEMGFKDEKSIRGSKAVADKADVGYVMTRVSEKGWNSMLPIFNIAVREKIIDGSILTDRKPTHILDIYKMRRGRYKMIRIWIKLHLGTGEREDLFVTTAENQPFTEPINLFSGYVETPITIEKGM